jgi:hypothetical protein
MKHTMSAQGAHAHFTIEDWRQVMDRNVATTSRRCDDKLAGTELGLPPRKRAAS